MQLELVRGDITQVPVEAVVTAANSALVGGGGVDGAIHAAAGPELYAALRPLAPCPPGQAVLTPAFRLPKPISWVVHAVGPRYGIDEPSDELLASAYLQSVRRCDEVGARSVAFPCISAGIYGFPLEQACTISVAALRAAPTEVERCVLVAFGSDVAGAWARSIG